MDELARETVLRHVTYGLYALAAGTPVEPSAMTVNRLTQASFEPSLLAVALEPDSRTLRAVRERGLFSGGMLGSEQRDLAGQLGRRSAGAPDRLRDVACIPSAAGTVALADTLGYVECRLLTEQPSEDHVLVLAEVIGAVVRRDGLPLTMRAAGCRYSG